ncbi:MAG: hypothetical protein HC836_31285 [Richelia sp. RM2_1_2]|nr:hypothetical protein [Richelia sp. RM2_1_2]
MSLPALSDPDQKKLAHTIREAVKVMNEIKLLRDGINDVKRNVAKDIDVPLKDLNRACRIAFKKQENSNAILDEREALDIVEEIWKFQKFNENNNKKFNSLYHN